MMKMNVYRMFLSGCRRCIHFFIITNHHSWAVFSNMQLFCIESTLFLWACDINVSFKPQHHLIIGIVNALRRSLTIPSTVTSVDTSSKRVHHPINNQCVVASMLQRRRDDGTSVVPSNTILSFQREREETGERRGSILGLVTIFLYCNLPAVHQHFPLFVPSIQYLQSSSTNTYCIVVRFAESSWPFSSIPLLLCSILLVNKMTN